MHWAGFRSLSISTTVAGGQAVSVQTGYHRGWHARANGVAATIERDGLGFLAIYPKCQGPCRIDLTYDGGWEYLLARGLSLLAMLGVTGYLWRAAGQSPFPTRRPENGHP
jgi:hypothetical protein